jgi:hypothetical protein
LGNRWKSSFKFPARFDVKGLNVSVELIVVTLYQGVHEILFASTVQSTHQGSESPGNTPRFPKPFHPKQENEDGE